MRAIHFSWRGTPMPTQRTSGRSSLMRATRSFSSLGREVAERGRVAADDLDARVVAAKVERQLGERALVAAAVEPHAVALLGAAARVAAHQLRPVDAVGKVLAEQVRGPYERHAVRDGQRRAEQRGAHLRVALGDGHGVHGHGADVAALAAGDHPVHHVHRVAVGGHRERDAEHLARADLLGARQQRVRAARRGSRRWARARQAAGAWR